MVLLTLCSATIVVAVEEGRRIFDNISKFILYLLSCNTAEIILMLLAVIINTDYVPFTPIMILFANLVVGMLQHPHCIV